MKLNQSGLFKAFERDDAHMYEFRFGNKYKMAPDRRYVMQEALSRDEYRVRRGYVIAAVSS